MSLRARENSENSGKRQGGDEQDTHAGRVGAVVPRVRDEEVEQPDGYYEEGEDDEEEYAVDELFDAGACVVDLLGVWPSFSLLLCFLLND